MSEPPAKKLKQPTISGFLHVQRTMSSQGQRGSASSPDLVEKRRRSAEAAERRLREKESSKSTSPSDSQASTGSPKSPAPNCSEPLFSDANSSLDQTLSYDVDQSSPGSPADCLSYGCDLSDLLRFPGCAPGLLSLTPTPDHAVLFNTNDLGRPGNNCHPPRPYPTTYHDRWDSLHVRMPCSQNNVYPGKAKDGARTLLHRWSLVTAALASPLKNTVDVEEAILSYNSRYVNKWNFVGLHQFLGRTASGGSAAADSTERALHLARTIPNIAKLALRLPEVVTGAVPLLRRGENRAVTLTQEQVACLLANAFFCTFPRRNAQQRQSEYSNFPSINFNRLFAGGSSAGGGLNHMRAAKLRCLLHYFHRVTTNMPTGTLTYQRCCITDLPKWDKCQQALGDLHVRTRGTIEDDGNGCLQVDFANKYLGGGVLGWGCVQEEIRFLLCPELLLTLLLVEELGDNECVVVTGAERFSSYTGYRDSFRWADNFNDSTPCDDWKRRHTTVVAIDALVFHTHYDQFRPPILRRELCKAFSGFQWSSLSQTQQAAVATGNWGCGAFGGDPHLKSLLQIMAASVANRQVLYFTFGNVQLAKDLARTHDLLRRHNVTVSGLWEMLCEYYSLLNTSKKVKQASGPGLHVFIRNKLSAYEEETDSENSKCPSPGGGLQTAGSTPVSLNESISMENPNVGGASSPVVLSSGTEGDIVSPSPQPSPFSESSDTVQKEEVAEIESDINAISSTGTSKSPSSEQAAASETNCPH